MENFSKPETEYAPSPYGGALKPYVILGIIVFSLFFLLWGIYHSTQARAIPPEPVTSYGFTMRIADSRSLTQYKRYVDLLAKNNQRYVRLNLVAYTVAPGADGYSIKWDENTLKIYDEAVAYAAKKKMKVMLITNVPEFAQKYAIADYKVITKNYYSFLAKRYKDKVTIWQLFNEVDIHSFRDHAHNPNLVYDNRYLSELTAVLSVASEAVKKEDKKAMVTTSVSHWVGAESSQAFLKKTTRLFDNTITSLDAVTLNLFPDMDMAEIDRLPAYVSYFSKRYKKPVYIGEIGVSTKPGTGFTEADQGKYMSLAIRKLAKSPVAPQLILYYELLDESAYSGDFEHENYYGIVKIDGTKKQSFDTIMRAMQL